MLRRSDLRPLSGRGKFSCSHCGSRVLDAKQACEALRVGSAVTPLDRRTAEQVATWLDVQSPKRAAEIRAWSLATFGPEPEPPPEG